MLNYKSVSIILLFLLALLLLVYIFFPIVAVCLMVIVILSYIILLIYGSVNIRSGFYLQALCSIKTKERIIALSFDDGPTEITPMILDVLKKHNVSATFFVVGKRIIGNEYILKRIDAEGHLVGNHSFSHHFWFDLFSRKKMIAELKKTEEIIESIIFKKTKLFRPPYSVTNPRLKKVIYSMGYTTIGWSLKSKDTMIKQEDKILFRLMNNLKSGAVILFHDTNERTLLVVEAFIKYALQNNYKIVRLDKFLKTTPPKNTIVI